MYVKQIDESLSTISELSSCFSAWESDVRIIGNVKASDALSALTFAKRVIFLFTRGIKNGCSSSCCLIFKPTGQATNGGCTCFDGVEKGFRIKTRKEWDSLINGIA
jgi:hypothetical protein